MKDENEGDSSLDKPDQHTPDYFETCRCGNDRHHHMVSAVPTYTLWGQFWITLIGVSATPIRIDFVCRICKQKFDFVTNPTVLKNFL